MDSDNVISRTPILGYNNNTPSTSALSSSASASALTPSSATPSSAASPTMEDTTSWLTIGRYLLIVLILAFLGFNLFTYLDTITAYIKNMITKLTAFFGYGVIQTTKKTINLSAQGTKGLVNVAAGTANSGIDLLNQSLTGSGSGSMKPIRNNIDSSNRSLDMVLNKASTSSASSASSTSSTSPLPDDAGSTTQSSKAKNKSGYCYIGEDRGFRSCIKVGEGDMCMSGDIFPTQDICVNPSLRN